MVLVLTGSVAFAATDPVKTSKQFFAKAKEALAADEVALNAVDRLSGPGWKLSLKEGWQVVPGEKSGS